MHNAINLEDLINTWKSYLYHLNFHLSDYLLSRCSVNCSHLLNIYNQAFKVNFIKGKCYHKADNLVTILWFSQHDCLTNITGRDYDEPVGHVRQRKNSLMFKQSMTYGRDEFCSKRTSLNKLKIIHKSLEKISVYIGNACVSCVFNLNNLMLILI